MKRNNLALITLLCVLAALPASAQQQKATGYSYYVISCISYMQHRARGTADAFTAADSFYVAGWLSAYDRVEAVQGGIPEDTTLDDVMLWLDHYCQAKPSGNLEAGLFTLGEEVRPRHTQTPPVKKPVADAPAPAAIVHTHKQVVRHKKAADTVASKPASGDMPHDVAQDLKPLTF